MNSSVMLRAAISKAGIRSAANYRKIDRSIDYVVDDDKSVFASLRSCLEQGASPFVLADQMLRNVEANAGNRARLFAGTIDSHSVAFKKIRGYDAMQERGPSLPTYQPTFMQIQANHAPFILFFDCYIVSSKLGLEAACQTGNPALSETYKKIRSSDSNYRHVAKLDIVKYSLISYRDVPWDDMVIRVECEDEADAVDFFAFAKENFPDATIMHQRSATAAQYHAALLPLRRYGNPWIFYCPNNDHPLVGQPTGFVPLLQLAEEIEPLYPDHFVGILYSHFTESQMMARPDQHRWFAVAGIINVEIGETRDAHVIRQSKFGCDSIIIYRLDALLEMFATATNPGRCIRLEDTGHIVTTRYRQILVLPKQELCRHYDGYFHVGLRTAPLFIPPGFWESDIRIRYGYDTAQRNFVNVNPFEELSFEGGAADVQSLLSELPEFWKKRITSVDSNPRMLERYQGMRGNSFQFGALRNHHQQVPSFVNYMRSAWKLMRLPIDQFDASFCKIEPLVLESGQTRADIVDEGQSAVYFVYSGKLQAGAVEFVKDDAFIVRGKIGLAFVGEPSAVLIKVVFNVILEGQPEFSVLNSRSF